ncbi:hypothetical protein FKP32DRAFT_132509 [Trametes sanguinea]|nr:hypothetical protein FKP32DRAFT_132509 [Trametes sanguinea]
MLLQNAHVAEPSTSAVEEIRLPSVNLLHPPATSSVSRDAGPPPLVPSPLGLQDPPRLSRLAHTTAGQPLRNATSRLNATSQLLDHPPAFDFEWQFPYVPMVHALPAIEALESASDIQAFSYAQSYTAPLYPLETFPVEVSQSVYEAWMPEEQCRNHGGGESRYRSGSPRLAR